MASRGLSGRLIRPACSAGMGAARRRRSQASSFARRTDRTGGRGGWPGGGGNSAGERRAASTAYGFRTPSVFEPVNSASAAGRHPALSAVRAAGASLARWAPVSRQASPNAAKNSLTGPPPPTASAASRASSTRAEAADGSMDGSLYGSGATAAPRSCGPVVAPRRRAVCTPFPARSTTAAPRWAGYPQPRWRWQRGAVIAPR
jgi:hypothetical protein